MSKAAITSIIPRRRALALIGISAPLAAIAGCAAISARGSFFDIAAQSPEGLSQKSTADLTNYLGDGIGVSQSPYARGRVLTELLERGVIRQQYADDIATGKVAIGMDVDEMIAACGCLEEGAHVTPSGKTVQWQWGQYGSVFTRDGVVVDIQS